MLHVPLESKGRRLDETLNEGVIRLGPGELVPNQLELFMALPVVAMVKKVETP